MSLINSDANTIIKIYQTEDIKKMEEEIKIIIDARICITNCPKIINSYIEDGKGYLFLENVGGETLCSLQSKSPDSILENIGKVHSILKKLIDYDIFFSEINLKMFSIKNNKLYLTDFSKAYRLKY